VSEHPESIREAAWFLWRNYPPAKDWGRVVLRNWISWHSSQASLCIVYQDETRREIVGVGMARPVMEPWQGAADCYEFDAEGRCLFIDAAIATQTDAFVMMFLGLLQRFGHRELIAYQRLPDPTVRVKRLCDMRRHLLRIGQLYV